MLEYRIVVHYGGQGGVYGRWESTPIATQAEASAEAQARLPDAAAVEVQSRDVTDWAPVERLGAEPLAVRTAERDELLRRRAAIDTELSKTNGETR